jgi:hypothetical protein
VEQVDPLLANYSEDGQVLGVKYSQLTALLIHAIQEQQRQIEELRAELESLRK